MHDIENRVGPDGTDQAGGDPPSGAEARRSGPEGSAASLEQRMERMEHMLDALASRIDGASEAGRPARSTDRAARGASAGSAEEDAPGSDRFWALTALKERMPAPGGVVYAGSVDVGLGHVEYQWGRPTDPLLRADWADRAERVAALGHPLRLSLLHRLLEGECTVAQLVDELDLASTGVAYHHLHQLQGAGWVTSPARGTWTVPASRVVPLLTIITALEEA
jgi:DNA-binding transcriptional ArsR family regulator